MVADMGDYRTQAREAIATFWQSREAAHWRQAQSGRADQGERAGVTAGKNMDGFRALMTDIVRRNGLERADVHLTRPLLTLPGFFRPTKVWDLLIMNQGRLVAAIEFKSQVGPSFGNNFNNRVEEAVGSALDLWTAYREGALGSNPPPFVGWLILVEDCRRSRTPIRDRSPHFPLLEEFDGSSYAERYDIFCRKVVQEKLYTSACLLLSARAAMHTGEHAEVTGLSGLTTFVTTLAGFAGAEAARNELSS